MRTVMVVAAVVAVSTSAAWAAEQGLTGSISDSMCKANHKVMSTNMSDRDCTLACTSKGAQYVFIANGKTYKLTNHDADLKIHAGHTVNLTGDVNGDTIRVSKVEMPSTSK
jgi:hypothetical protein